jgi:hypothetical protein
MGILILVIEKFFLGNLFKTWPNRNIRWPHNKEHRLCGHDHQRVQLHLMWHSFWFCTLNVLLIVFCVIFLGHSWFLFLSRPVTRRWLSLCSLVSLPVGSMITVIDIEWDQNTFTQLVALNLHLF